MLEIRAIEVNDNAAGDAPILPCMLDQIPAKEIVASVSGDGAYDTKGCHEAIAQRRAHAVIPNRKNAKPWKDQRPGATARNAIMAATRLLAQENLEELERLSPAQPCRNQDALLQAAW